MRLFLLISICIITVYSCTNGATNISKNTIQLPAADENSSEINSNNEADKPASDKKNYSGEDCDQQKNYYTNPRMMLW